MMRYVMRDVDHVATDDIISKCELYAIEESNLFHPQNGYPVVKRLKRPSPLLVNVFKGL